MKIEITDKERLFLSKQHEILGHLDTDNSEYHFKLAEQLRDGHKWLYQQSFDSFCENLSDEDTNLVLDILRLYEVMNNSYKSLSDKKNISEDEVKFPGFDGNNESEFMGFVDALRNSNRYVSVIEAGHRNSHSQKVQKYGSMINKWKEFEQPFNLSYEQLSEILGK